VSVTVGAIFDPRPGWTGAHTNTMEATWKHVNGFLNALFAALCRASTIQTFTISLLVHPHVDWSLQTICAPDHRLLLLQTAHASPHETATFHCSASFDFPYHTQPFRRTLPSYLLKIFLLRWSETTVEPNLCFNETQFIQLMLKSPSKHWVKILALSFTTSSYVRRVGLNFREEYMTECWGTGC
jgi:hypothetical protein